MKVGMFSAKQCSEIHSLHYSTYSWDTLMEGHSSNLPGAWRRHLICKKCSILLQPLSSNWQPESHRSKHAMIRIELSGHLWDQYVLWSATSIGQPHVSIMKTRIAACHTVESWDHNLSTPWIKVSNIAKLPLHLLIKLLDWIISFCPPGDMESVKKRLSWPLSLKKPSLPVLEELSFFHFIFWVGRCCACLGG